jgi:hypothetical protein
MSLSTIAKMRITHVVFQCAGCGEFLRRPRGGFNWPVKDLPLVIACRSCKEVSHVPAAALKLKKGLGG